MARIHDKWLGLIVVVAPDEPDDAYRDEQAHLLRDLIEDQIDGVEAQLGTSETLPDGVRAGEVITIGHIAMAVLPAAVTALFELLRDWRKGKTKRSYKIRVGEVEVALPGNSTWEEAEAKVKRLLELQSPEGQ